MKRYLLYSMVFLMFTAVWGNGCSGQPTTSILTAEPTVAQMLSAGQFGEVQEMVNDEVIALAPIPEAGAEQVAVMPTSVPEPTQVKPASELELPEGAEDLVRLVRENLAGRLDLASSEAIRLVSVEPVQWSDASLGCPQPGMMYAQVITPGFLVMLEAEGERYEYHTDEGRSVVLCEPRGASRAGPSQRPDTTVQDGWPNQTRDYDVTIVPPTERK